LQHARNCRMDGYLNHEHYVWNNTVIRDRSITVMLRSNYCNNIRISSVFKFSYF